MRPARVGIVAHVACCLIAMQALAAAPQSSGTIAGRIALPEGSPLVGIRVSAMAADGAGPVTTLMGLSQTDPDGRFRIEGLTPGRYYLLLGPLDNPFFVPGVTSRTDATVITLVSGATENRDFRLRRPLPLTVSGRVIREGHDVGKWVILSGGVTRDLTATIGPDGSFSFANVRSGTYTLRVGPNIAPRPITITVGDKDISGLEVVLPKSVVTSAAVTFNVDLQVEGSEPLPPLPDFWLILDKTDASLPPFRITPSGSTLVSEMPFAEYRAYVSSFRDLLLNAHGPLPPGYTVKSVRAGSTDLLKEPLKISASGEVSIAIMLAYKAPARFKVSGRVTGLATAPVKAETVTLSGIELDEPLTSPIASDGAFHFTGLLPGSYRLTLQPQSDPFPREILVGNSDQAKVEIAMVIPSRKVSGRIVDVATLGPLGPNDFVELTLSVTSKWWPSWPWSTESIARADGSFVFNEVPIQPGPYLLEIALCRNHSCVSNSAGQSLDLADRDVSDLRISIANESKE